MNYYRMMMVLVLPLLISCAHGQPTEGISEIVFPSEFQLSEIEMVDYLSWRAMEENGKRVILIDLTGQGEKVAGALKFSQETILRDINVRQPDVVIPYCGCVDDHSAKVLAFNLKHAGVRNVFVLINGEESIDKYINNLQIRAISNRMLVCGRLA